MRMTPSGMLRRPESQIQKQVKEDDHCREHANNRSSWQLSFCREGND